MEFNVVVMAAGLGTRMKSPLPKVLHRIGNWPLLLHVLDAAAEASAQNVVAILGHGQDLVEKEWGGWPASVNSIPRHTVTQKEQKGTGDALLSALPKIKELGESPILILSGDAPVISPEQIQYLLEQHQNCSADLSVASMIVDNPYGYGRIIAQAGKIEKIVEEKDAQESEKLVKEVNGGVYVVNPNFLAEFLPKLTPSPKTGEFYLTDLISLGREAGHKIYAHNLEEKWLMGVNTMAQLADAAKIIRKEKILALQLAGVRVEDPDSLFIDMDVECESGVVIEANVSLLGKTKISAGAYIECGARIEDSSIGANTRIKAHSCIEESSIGADCAVGPMAHLRPKSIVENNVKIGNFVETKKMTMQEGAKASHLSYIGDADIGRDVNLGCGFITCNFDGSKEKKFTKIESGAFVGSDVQAVAPVTIGKDAYVASGSTINKDVPADALGIARSRQENKIGFAKKLRKK